MIHLSDARKLIESKDPVDLSFWKSNGEEVHARYIVCTSSNFHNNTFNFKFIDSGEIRKVKALLMFNLSGEEIFI